MSNSHLLVKKPRKMVDKMKWRVFAISLLALALRVEVVEPSSEVVKKMTLGFTKVLEECKNEINFSDHIMQDFYNFWKEDYELVNREVGCAIMCMASKFDMINDENKLHHANAHSFAKSHGADDEMAQQVVTMIHECEKTHDDIRDDCGKTLEVAKCFRTKIHALKWAPDMEVVLEEVMTEVKA